MVRLLPADEVREERYEMPKFRAPVLHGWQLTAFVNLLETPVIGTLIAAHLLHINRVPKVLREPSVPEPPTFYPQWPPPSRQARKGPFLLQDVSSLATEQLVEAAASCCEERVGVCRGRQGAMNYHQAYLRKHTTPTEVAEQIIRAVEDGKKRQPAMLFMMEFDPRDLRRQAAESTHRYELGRPLSALDGVPYAVKDCVDALPYRSSLGTSFMRETRAVDKDAPCVAALRAAGAVLIGKTLMVEYGISAVGYNAAVGTPLNPYSPPHMCGGSSSGSAAAVAAGLCPFAIGTDAGGSVRVPSSFCGLTGLKPTFGRDAPGSGPENDLTVCNLGPLAATTADALLMYSLISNAGVEEPLAPCTLPKHLFSAIPEDLRAVRSLRVGVYSSWLEAADPEVVAGCKNAIVHLEKLGVEVVEVSIPELELSRVAFMVTIITEMLQSHKHHLANPATRYRHNLETRGLFAMAQHMTTTDYLQAAKIRTRVMGHFQRVLSKVDYIIAPTEPNIAFPARPEALLSSSLNMDELGRSIMYTSIINFTGLPAISVPVGVDSAGLPIGLQLIGRAFDEAGLLYLASVLELELQACIPLPPLFYNVLEEACKRSA